MICTQVCNKFVRMCVVSPAVIAVIRNIDLCRHCMSQQDRTCLCVNVWQPVCRSDKSNSNLSLAGKAENWLEVLSRIHFRLVSLLLPDGVLNPFTTLGKRECYNNVKPQRRFVQYGVNSSCTLPTCCPLRHVSTDNTTTQRTLTRLKSLNAQFNRTDLVRNI